MAAYATGGGGAGQRLLECFHGGGISNVPEGHRCGRCHFDVLILQATGQDLDGGGISANTDGVDHADQQLSFERREWPCAVLRRPPIREWLPEQFATTRPVAHRSTASPTPAPPPPNRRSPTAYKPAPWPRPEHRSGAVESIRARSVEPAWNCLGPATVAAADRISAESKTRQPAVNRVVCMRRNPDR